MNINIQSLHFTAKQELVDFVNEKVGKLSHFHKRIQYADVCLRLEKSGTRENKVCEIKVGIPGNDLFVKRHNETFEEAVASSVKALEKQMDRES